MDTTKIFLFIINMLSSCVFSYSSFQQCLDLIRHHPLFTTLIHSCYNNGRLEAYSSRKNKLLIFARYLALFFILLSLFLFNSSILSSSIIIFLILLINSQIRFFSLNRPLWIICSILLDLGLILCLLQSHATAICLYFILPVLDVILLLSRNYHVMFLAIFSIIFLTLYYHSFTNVDEIFSLLFNHHQLFSQLY